MYSNLAYMGSASITSCPVVQVGVGHIAHATTTRAAFIAHKPAVGVPRQLLYNGKAHIELPTWLQLMCA